MNSAHPSLGKAMQFDKVKANGLQLTCSPGKNVTSFGSLLRTVGVFFMPCVHERRVWLRIRPGRALLAISSVKRTTDFEKEFARRAGEVIGDIVLELALNQPAPLLKRLSWFDWLFAAVVAAVGLFAVGQYQDTL